MINSSSHVFARAGTLPLARGDPLAPHARTRVTNCLSFDFYFIIEFIIIDHCIIIRFVYVLLFIFDSYSLILNYDYPKMLK